MRDHSPDNSDTNRRKRPVKKASRKPPKAKRPKRKRSVIHVVCNKEFKYWLVRAIRLYDEDGNKLDGFYSTPGAGLIGAYYASYRCPTKAKAVHLARTEAQLHRPSSVIIHRADGQFQEERSFGTDPRASKG